MSLSLGLVAVKRSACGIFLIEAHLKDRATRFGYYRVEVDILSTENQQNSYRHPLCLTGFLDHRVDKFTNLD